MGSLRFCLMVASATVFHPHPFALNFGSLKMLLKFDLTIRNASLPMDVELELSSFSEFNAFLCVQVRRLVCTLITCNIMRAVRDSQQVP